MDIEKMSHTGYKMSVAIAIVLSCMVVTFAALLGRGTLNLKGALITDEPKDITVITLVEPKVETSVKVSAINFLRKDKREADARPTYDYHVHFSDGSDYLAKIGYDITLSQWALKEFTYLHADPAENASVGIEEETPPSL